MNAVFPFVVVGATMMSLPPEPFSLETVETRPVSGPVIGQNLSYRFGARHVTGKYLNPSSTLE